MRINLTILLWVITFPLLAYEPIAIREGQEEIWVNQNSISIFKDSNRCFNYKNVLHQKFDLTSIDLNSPNFTTSNYWIKLDVANNSKSDQWFLEILNYDIENVSFYDVVLNKFCETGFAKDFNSRYYFHKNFVFNLSIPSQTQKTFLIKVNSSKKFNPIMKIRTDKDFILFSNTEYLLLGLFYGLLLLVSLYNFFMYLSIRDITYLYYFFYVISISLNSLKRDGIGFQFLWPSYPAFNNYLNFAPELLLIFFVLYSIHFLELKTKYISYYYYVLSSLLIYIFIYLLNVFSPIHQLTYFYMLPFIVIYIVSILLYKKGYKASRFYILGYSTFIVGQILNMLFIQGLQVQIKIAILLLVYGVNIGFFLESIILTLALADKFKILKKEGEIKQQLIIKLKDTASKQQEIANKKIITQLKENEELKNKINKELESKVSERTQELEEAKMKLQEQANLINKMNVQLDIENFKLKKNVTAINLERGLLKALSFEEFVQTFSTQSTCIRFIDELKWGKDFKCYKCGGDKYTKASALFARKCSKCHYIETINANTIFHNIKFPIEKAFQIIFLILTSEKDISSYELATKVGLQQKTCWAFRQRIFEKMKTKKITEKDIWEHGWGILIKE